ncbi:hypothetical protein ACFWTE_11150 [Nocardiopsis sp. NPDC058631]|uniref:hypothetical protein n=1 Tax=Nocardiopsis sp. NPDC058631 TaxID=3346566 RepID=UPI003648552B
MTTENATLPLPGISVLRDLGRSAALLEFLVAPDNRFPTHGFQAGGLPGWDLMTFDNGGGDGYAIALSPTAALIRCFDHESAMSPYANDGEIWPGVADPVPAEFVPLLSAPEFVGPDEPEVTALLWRGAGDDSWRTGAVEFPDEDPDADGAGWLLDRLYAEDPALEFCHHFNRDYRRDLDLAAVRRVFAGGPLTAEVVAGINTDQDPETLLRRASEL